MFELLVLNSFLYFRINSRITSIKDYSIDKSKKSGL